MQFFRHDSTDRNFILIDLDRSGLLVQLGLFGYHVSICLDHEPHLGFGIPDGRFLGFWTEDFEFDHYPRTIDDDLPTVAISELIDS